MKGITCNLTARSDLPYAVVLTSIHRDKPFCFAQSKDDG